MSRDTVRLSASEDGRPSERPHVRAVACVAGLSLERDVPCELIGEYIGEPENLVWVDVQDPGPEELSMLLEEFGFHPLALENLVADRQRPRVDEYKGHVFVVTYGIAASDTRGLQTSEVDLFIGRNYLVTIHRGVLPALQEAFTRWTRGGPMLNEGVGFLVYTVMDALIESYFPVLDGIEEELDEAEMTMFTRFREGSIQDLLEIKRRLFTLRRVLYPMRDAYSLLLRPSLSLFSSSSHVYLQDVYNHILRILDVLEIERDRAAGALDAYLAVVSNRLNGIMQTLTVVSVSVGIAGCVFGIWGMNVQEAPHYLSSPAFWWIVVGTLALSAGVIGLCRMRRWL